MAFADDAKRVLAVASVGLHTLETIGDITKAAARGGSVAELAQALQLISALVDTVRQGLEGSIAPEAVEHERQLAAAMFKTDVQEARDALDAKFPR